MQGNRRATPKDKHLVENINGFSLEEIVSFLFKHNLVKESYYLLWIYALLLRWTVGLHSYSGAKTPPMYGDYEAQRHWMEITINLPMSDWYFDTPQNNLLYWGLDYPPLTAYVSYFFGIFAAKVEPEMVALTSSHGYETSTSKVIMRLTVLFSDILLFIPALFWLTNTNFDKSEWTRKTVLKLILLSQPAFLLIDHGHFQYNCVFLGLTTLAAVLIINDHDFFGSVCFSLALNFKQMALYYAPAIGMYLFAKCIYQKSFITHLTMLGIAVVSTFALMWYPFCFYAPQGQTCFSSIAQVIHRVFPFGRGLFEDKVANLWCILDLFIKIKRRMAPVSQMRLCTLATFLGFLPSVIDLVRRKPTKIRFFLGLFNSSMAFFLFSFQVHEKTILLPLLPISFLFHCAPLLCSWFSFLATFSMYFLILKDSLNFPYFVLQMYFFFIGVLPFMKGDNVFVVNNSSMCAPGHDESGRPNRLLQAFVLISFVGVVVLHAAHAVVEPPTKYPHIHDYLFAGYSCGHFLLALVYCTYWQWTLIEDKQQRKLKNI